MNLDDLISDLKILQRYEPAAPIAMHSGGLFVGGYKPEKLTPEELEQLRKHGWHEYQDSWFVECR